jgi:hypothetical protein
MSFRPTPSDFERAKRVERESRGSGEISLILRLLRDFSTPPVPGEVQQLLDEVEGLEMTMKRVSPQLSIFNFQEPNKFQIAKFQINTPSSILLGLWVSK